MNHQAVSVINQGRGEAKFNTLSNTSHKPVPCDLRYMSSPLLEFEVSLQFQDEVALKLIGSALAE